MMIKIKYPVVVFLLLSLLGACMGYRPLIFQEERSENPYYFPARRLESKFQSDHGSFKLVENFNKRSSIHRGLENYRVAFIEANPNAFILPYHSDAESVAIVLRGRGTITVVKRFKKETYNLGRGDVLRLKSGNIVYGANSGDSEKFKLAILAQPVNTPGIFKEFFSAGESFLKVFSNNILESSFDISKDQIDNIFGRQKKGPIVTASKDQIEALSRQATSTQEIGKDSSYLFNVLQHPLGGYSRYGRMFEAKPDTFDQLGDVNVLVGLLEINQEALLVPHYNWKSTIVFLIEEGKGRIEMASPNEKSRGNKDQYQKISSELSPGDVFVVPAGYPHSIIASQNKDFRAFVFGINGRDNRRSFFAGRDNVLNIFGREAKELSFNAPLAQVEETLGKQQESYFVPAHDIVTTYIEKNTSTSILH